MYIINLISFETLFIFFCNEAQVCFLFCGETLFGSVLRASKSILKCKNSKTFGLEKRVKISEENSFHLIMLWQERVLHVSDPTKLPIHVAILEEKLNRYLSHVCCQSLCKVRAAGVAG